MTEVLRDCIGFACLGAAILGSAYALFGAALASRLRGRTLHVPRAGPGVTILKPLRGAEPALHDNLGSFCGQDYGAPVQVLFGVEQESDPAVAVVRALQAQWPALDIELVVSGAATGANPKISTLLALEPRIAHPIVVLADSDMAVPPDYVARVVAALQGPGVGLVTCLYRGDARAGLWSRLAAMAIDDHFLPSVLVGVKLGLARPCFGSTIALRRETLEAIGGFAAFSGHLADDHAIGEAVRRRGLAVAIPDLVLAHTCSERTLGELVRHELRWARTIRAVSPAGYAASGITHAFPLAVLGVAFTGVSMSSTAVLIAAIASRLVLAVRVAHTLASGSGRWWLGPVRDLISFAIYLASFFVGVVTWRGRRYRVRPDGTLAAIGESNS